MVLVLGKLAFFVRKEHFKVTCATAVYLRWTRGQSAFNSMQETRSKHDHISGNLRTAGLCCRILTLHTRLYTMNGSKVKY